MIPGIGKSFAAESDDEHEDDVEKARQVALLFNRERLKDLKQGINMVIEAFTDVIELDPKKEVSITYRNYEQKLERIEKESWARLRQRHLNSHPQDKESSNVLLCDRLLKFISTLDSIKQTLVDQLQNNTKREDNLINEVKDLRKDLAEEKQNCTNLKWKLDKVSKEYNSKLSSTAILSEQLQEKQRIIQQLQRNGTVQLWEKEKKTLLDNVAQHERELEKELADLQHVHEETKDRMNRRIRELDENLKVEKMKDIVSRIADRGDTFTELEDSKRRMYTLEKDIAYIEKEIVDHQKLFVGCIKGVRTDFTTIVERDKENGTIAKDDARKMTLILDAIYNGVRSGRLEITKADLPLHYIALEEEITGHPSQKKLTKTQLRPVEKRLEEIKPEERTASSNDINQTSSNSNLPSPVVPPPIIVSPEADTNAEKPSASSKSRSPVMQRGRARTAASRSRSPRPSRLKVASNGGAPLGSNGSLRKANNGKPRAGSTAKNQNSRKTSSTNSPLSEKHEELINPNTGLLDIDTSLKLFKGYTKEQIIEHYNMFIKYDTSKDFSLDLSETREAIQSTVGDYYSDKQIKEVMDEVDVNRSNTIDFYEYLGVASMLNRRSGKSEVFRSGIVKHGGTSVSKMCTVQ